MHSTLSLLSPLLGVLLLSSGSAAAQGANPTTLVSTFVEHDAGLVRVTLLRTGPISIALTASATDEGAPAAPPSQLFTAPAVPHQLHGGLSAVRNADESWSAAASFLGGASIMLHVWRFDLQALEGGGFASSELLAHHVIRDVSLATDSEPLRKAGNLESPSVFRSKEATVLFASAYVDDRPELMHERVVVLVPLSAELPETPRAQMVGLGSDPKPIGEGASVLLAVRRAGNVPEALGDAPLRFLRSTDLEAWVEDEDLSGAMARPAYSVANHRGTIWLATWSEQVDPRVTVHSFDVTRREWATVVGLGTRPYRGTPSADGVWLISTTVPSAGRPELRYVCHDGSIVRE